MKNHRAPNAFHSEPVNISLTSLSSGCVLILPLCPFFAYHPHQTPSLGPFRADCVQLQIQVLQSRVLFEAFGQGLTRRKLDLECSSWIDQTLSPVSSLQPRDEGWSIRSIKYQTVLHTIWCFGHVNSHLFVFGSDSNLDRYWSSRTHQLALTMRSPFWPRWILKVFRALASARYSARALQGESNPVWRGCSGSKLWRPGNIPQRRRKKLKRSKKHIENDKSIQKPWLHIPI